jgi:protein associated with RNAse G/E
VRATLRVGGIQYYCCKACSFCWRAETLTKV